jgi:hypothetical protein
MIAVIPDGEQLKSKLKAWLDNIFMVLPEDTARHWIDLGHILDEQFVVNSPVPCSEWETKVIKIWKGETGLTNKPHVVTPPPDPYIYLETFVDEAGMLNVRDTVTKRPIGGLIEIECCVALDDYQSIKLKVIDKGYKPHTRIKEHKE